MPRKHGKREKIFQELSEKLPVKNCSVFLDKVGLYQGPCSESFLQDQVNYSSKERLSTISAT